MSSEDLPRLKRVRGAHRASVSRLITQVEETLAELTDQSIVKLQQLKESLNSKLKAISPLDGKILNLTAEEELDHEVQQADETREKISLCIIKIQAALNGTRKKTATARELTDPPRPPATTRSRDSSPEHHHACHVKLPKLSIKTFGGDLTKWTTFWDAFDAAVHSNPVLSNIERFNYLNSLLDSAAAEAVAGLSLTDANYSEAIAILKKRFGNTQLIVNRHMDALLRITAVTSHYDVKGLRCLYDAIETNVRGLKALEVEAESYGSLMVSILMNKMPPEIRLIVSRNLNSEKWDFKDVMQILEQEVDARERSLASTQQSQQPSKQPTSRGTATALTTDTTTIKCAFCNQDHRSQTCTKVTDVKARKDALRKSGRCYLCLRKGHLVRQCRSSSVCRKCGSKHHSAICSRPNPNDAQPSTNDPQPSSPQLIPQPTRNTNTMYVDAQTPILLQTAKLHFCDPKNSATPAFVEARAIMDTGSQRTYVTRRIKQCLRLPISGIESLHIKTFGRDEGQDTMCETVELGLLLKNGEIMKIQALVVPVICNPLTSQPISHTKETYDHLLDLELADAANENDYLEVDALIGSDVYWSLVTGEVRRGSSGPMAIQTKVGWVLSGPTSGLATSVNLSVCNITHTLMTVGTVCATEPEQGLDEQLKRFWDLETLGIVDGESGVHEKFVQQIRFNGERYCVTLPWKDNCEHLPDNLSFAVGALMALLKDCDRTQPC